MEQSPEGGKEEDSGRGKANANFMGESMSGLFKEQQPYCNPEATSITSKG